MLRNKGAAELFCLVVVALVAIVGFSYARIVKKDDTPIEEASEYVIYKQTGVDVDLTPNSPEVTP